jgi:hypothetical protein
MVLADTIGIATGGSIRLTSISCRRRFERARLWDVNLDGAFNSSDLVHLFQVGRYETAQSATWSEGDWDGNGRFDSSDLVLALAEVYETDLFDDD